MIRTLALAGGVAGGLGLSQFPEFSQQYTQRLGGAVDELSRQIRRYEADAAEAGLTLEALLAGLAREGPLAQKQAANMAEDVARHGRLSADLDALEGAGPFMRARLATHLADREIAARAYEAFKPAIPASFEGAVFAGTGAFAGWAAISAILAVLGGLWSLLTAPFRRKNPA
jgi:hypothetical protein